MSSAHVPKSVVEAQRVLIAHENRQKELRKQERARQSALRRQEKIAAAQLLAQKTRTCAALLPAFHEQLRQHDAAAADAQQTLDAVTAARDADLRDAEAAYAETVAAIRAAHAEAVDAAAARVAQEASAREKTVDAFRPSCVHVFGAEVSESDYSGWHSTEIRYRDCAHCALRKVTYERDGCW